VHHVIRARIKRRGVEMRLRSHSSHPTSLRRSWGELNQSI
jgi:hypothetical protein